MFFVKKYLDNFKKFQNSQKSILKNFSKPIKINFFLIFLVLVFLSSCGETESSFQQTQNQGSGIITQTIHSPYQTELQKQSARYPTGLTEATGFKPSIVDIRYSDFKSYTEAVSKEPYCKFGGMYKVEIFNNPIDRGIYHKEENLFYCKTSLDLLKDFKIPSSWTNSELILYCNDGADVNMPKLNPDFLSTKINNYRVCILKNLDLEEDNSVVYGIVVGNTILDDNPNYTPPNVQDVIFNYDGNSKTYTISKGNLDFSGPSIADFFQTTYNIEELTRIILLKRFQNGQIIYGYETVSKDKVYGTESSLKAIYSIKIPNSYNEFNVEKCLKHLAKYEPGNTQTGFISKTEKVSCYQQGGFTIILINGPAIQEEKKAGEISLNLFKNIILSLE